MDIFYDKVYIFPISRLGNPTRSQYEAAFAAVEGGTDAAAFSSGVLMCVCVRVVMCVRVR